MESITTISSAISRICSPKFEQFEYRTMPSEPKSFRQIEIQAATKSRNLFGSEGLHLKLTEREIVSPDAYNALSYTWGPQTSSRRVRVDTEVKGYTSGYLLISQSLEYALFSLRDSNKGKLPLFVDQICINQKDKADKSQQVQLMGEVYANCSRVIVWLGPSTRLSDRFMDFTVDICHEGVLSRLLRLEVPHFIPFFRAVTDPNADHNLDGGDRELQELVRALILKWSARYPTSGAIAILKRPWFDRLWIIQEMCLGPEVIFVCGQKSLCYDCFRSAFLFCMFCNNYRLGHKTQRVLSQRKLAQMNQLFKWSNVFTKLTKVRNLIQKGREPRLSLYDLVKKYSVNEKGLKVQTSNRRDRIYGLFGLAKQGDRIKKAIGVDYNKTVREIYMGFAAEILQENVDVLLYSQFPKSELAKDEPPLPTWVPDWNSNLDIPYGYFDENTSAFSAGGGHHSPFPEVDIQTGTLFIQGPTVDQIVKVGECMLQSQSRQIWADIVEYRSVKYFFDELDNFLAISGEIPTSPYNTKELRYEAATRIPGAGLSIYFGDKAKVPGSQELLGRLYDDVRRWGNKLVMIDALPQTVAKIRPKTMPWYLYPFSEVDAMRDCATNPLGGLVMCCAAAGCCLLDILGIGLAVFVVWSFGRLVGIRDRFASLPLDTLDSYKQSVEKCGLDPSFLESPEMEVYKESLFKNIGRKLFLTKNGYVGLCPPHTEPGDIVAVFWGGTVPHVLRPEAKSEQQMLELGAQYSYVGEAYCDGVMNGEILTGTTPSTFRIV